MNIERHHVKSLLTGLLIFVEATILAIILSFVIREYIGPELFLAFFLFPEDINVPYPLNLGGLLVIVLGFILVIWANYTLLFVGKIGLKAREPFHVPSTLVVDGPYKFSRNPLYLAVVMITFGLAILVGSLSILIISVALFFIFGTWFIRWEEKKLEEAFGEEYREYKNQVRRWL
ncbi:MAG: methyltransferase family protein [Promethearchaeota archaeon]